MAKTANNINQRATVFISFQKIILEFTKNLRVVLSHSLQNISFRSMSVHQISGQIVDLAKMEVFAGRITIEDHTVIGVEPLQNAPDLWILPGFIDAHVHIESSMLVPSEFARLAVRHGTVATISDPHEIGNVLGVEGVHYMIENSKQVNFKCFFGAPSCVPATPFETAGAEINLEDLNALLRSPDIYYLAEMMNWPGVLHRDPLVMDKIKLALSLNKPVDGHAPGLRGQEASRYAGAGITTDHECFTREEALDKLQSGMKIIIREGSAAKNFEALIDLVPEYADRIMFCSDDKHPDSLVIGHINQLVARGVQRGIDPLLLLRVACMNPVLHYQLPVGLLKVGDRADLVTTADFKSFTINETYIDGQCVYAEDQTLIASAPISIVNNFESYDLNPADFTINIGGSKIRVMTAEDGQLITGEQWYDCSNQTATWAADLDQDLLKIAVINRYQKTKPAVAVVKNFGLKKGAIASSVAHDSHNIIAVGTNDDDLCKSVNLLMENGGGISVVDIREDLEEVLPLPIAGLMSAENGSTVAEAYTKIDQLAKALGSSLSAPFMTLSFMALLVIPQLKLSDKGLFDGSNFEFVDLFKD